MLYRPYSFFIAVGFITACGAPQSEQVPLEFASLTSAQISGTPLVITDDNALAIAREAMTENLFLDLEATVELANVVYGDFTDLVRTVPNETPIEWPCSKSGSIAIVGSTQDSTSDFSFTGDYAVADYSNCVDTDLFFGEIAFDGRLSTTVEVGDGVSAATIWLNFEEYGFRLGTFDSFVLDGSVRYIVTVGDFLTEPFRIQRQTPSLVGMIESQGKEVKNALLDWSMISNGTALRYSYTTEGEIVSTNGSYAFRSNSLEGTSGIYPDTGTLLLVGANNAKISITAENFAEMSYIVDTDGDGFGERFVMTWPDFVTR